MTTPMTYTHTVTFSADLPKIDPARMDTVVRDAIESWRSNVIRNGLTPVGSVVDIRLCDVAFHNEHRVLEVSGQVRRSNDWTE